jgi:hypothetical protein
MVIQCEWHETTAHVFFNDIARVTSPNRQQNGNDRRKLARLGCLEHLGDADEVARCNDGNRIVRTEVDISILRSLDNAFDDKTDRLNNSSMDRGSPSPSMFTSTRVVGLPLCAAVVTLAAVERAEPARATETIASTVSTDFMTWCYHSASMASPDAHGHNFGHNRGFSSSAMIACSP